MGPLWKLRCCIGGPQMRHLNLSCSSAWKKMLPKGLRVVTEQRCCFGAIWSSSSPCYQGSCSRGTCRLSPSRCQCLGTNLSLPACQETHQASRGGNVQPSPHCHAREIVAVTRNLLAALQANIGASKGLLPSSWVVLLIPQDHRILDNVFLCVFKWSLWATRCSNMRNFDVLDCTTISVLLSEGSSQRFHSLASLHVFQGRGKSPYSKCFVISKENNVQSSYLLWRAFCSSLQDPSNCLFTWCKMLKFWNQAHEVPHHL